MAAKTEKARKVHVRRGQDCIIECRSGVALELTHFKSGAIVLRNARTGSVVRSWGPKDKE